MTEYPMLINGQLVSGTASFDVINPATGEVFAQAPDCTAEELDLAMETAQAALALWGVDDKARRLAISAAADRLAEAKGELSALLTTEQGKPLEEAAREIDSGVLWLRYFADLEIDREFVEDGGGRSVEIVRRPVGVVAAITPWNFPIGLAMWKVGPALRAGNTMVLKPSPHTPLTTLAYGRLLADVLPPGVLNIVTGKDSLGPMVTGHRIPRKISFTGSTAVGKLVARSAADDLKRVTLELGGNDPAIVLDDVDPVQTAEKLFRHAFVNNGQVCLAIKRVYVPRSLHDSLVDAMAALASSAKVGDGTESGVRLGPINNQAQLDHVESLVDDALAGGAVAASGGARLDRPGYFFAPTIIAQVTDGARVVDEEQFGPVLPIVAYDDIDDVVERANRGNFGLTASVWSADVDRASSVAQRLDCGQVSVNVHGGAVLPNLPFSGHKWSGVGVENGIWGLNSFTETQVISLPA